MKKTLVLRDRLVLDNCKGDSSIVGTGKTVACCPDTVVDCSRNIEETYYLNVRSYFPSLDVNKKGERGETTR